MELDAFVGDLAAHPAAEQLRHRDQARRIFSVNALAHAFANQGLCSRNLGVELHHLELGVLHLCERLAEQNALFCPAPGFFPEHFASRHRTHTRDEAFVLKLHHLLLEPAADLTDRVGNRHAHVIEKKQPRVGTPVSNFIEQFVAEAGRVCRNQDLRIAAVTRIGVSDDEQAEPVRGRGVGDVGL